MKKIISFDLDDTLIHQNKERKYQQIQEVFINAGFFLEELEILNSVKIANRYYDTMGFKSAENKLTFLHNYIQKIMQLVGCNNHVVRNNLYNFYQEYERNDRNFIIPDDVINLLSSLKKRGGACRHN